MSGFDLVVWRTGDASTPPFEVVVIFEYNTRQTKFIAQCAYLIPISQ